MYNVIDNIPNYAYNYDSFPGIGLEKESGMADSQGTDRQETDRLGMRLCSHFGAWGKHKVTTDML